MVGVVANGLWIFIGVIVVASIVAGILRNTQREKTIRAAIDKGVALDPSVLNEIRSHGDARGGLRTGAIITFFVGLGLVVLGFFVSQDGDNALHPLMGVCGFMWCISLGLLVSSFLVKPGKQD